MRQGVAKRVSQYQPPGDYGFEVAYKLGWDAAIQWMKGNKMPTPNGNITTSEIWTSPTEPTTTPEKTPEAEEKEEE